MLFEFKIINKEIYDMNAKEVIKENIKNKCKLYFDKKTYEGKELFITFINKFGYSRTIVLGKWQKMLSCEIPPHILDHEYFKVFCYTKDLHKTKTIKIYNKMVVTDINLLIEQINKKIDNILYENGELKCYSNNILINTIPIRQDMDEEMIQNIINNNLSRFKEEIDEQFEDCLTEKDLEYLIISL